MSTDKVGNLRINHFLARSGVASRRGAEALIQEGRVTMNGETVTSLATTVDPERDAVKVDGKRVQLLKEQGYFALYKPKEVVSTLEDPEGRRCLTAYMPKGAKGLFPVGRLDYHSEGLILLTSDGEMSNRLLHPRYKVVKTYQVKVKGDPPYEALERLRRGIVLDGRRTEPVAIRRIPSRETRHTWLEIEMTEGRKNQLREMFFRVEHPVIKLKRVAMGPVRLGKMNPGDVRPLSDAEEEALKRHTGLLEGAGAPPPKAAPTRPRDHRPKTARESVGDRPRKPERREPPKVRAPRPEAASAELRKKSFAGQGKAPARPVIGPRGGSPSDRHDGKGRPERSPPQRSGRPEERPFRNGPAGARRDDRKGGPERTFAKKSQGRKPVVTRGGPSAGRREERPGDLQKRRPPADFVRKAPSGPRGGRTGPPEKFSTQSPGRGNERPPRGKPSDGRGDEWKGRPPGGPRGGPKGSGARGGKRVGPDGGKSAGKSGPRQGQGPRKPKRTP